MASRQAEGQRAAAAAYHRRHASRSRTGGLPPSADRRAVETECDLARRRRPRGGRVVCSPTPRSCTWYCRLPLSPMGRWSHDGVTGRCPRTSLPLYHRRRGRHLRVHTTGRRSRPSLRPRLLADVDRDLGRCAGVERLSRGVVEGDDHGDALRHLGVVAIGVSVRARGT